jgi:hypothetical protein
MIVIQDSIGTIIGTGTTGGMISIGDGNLGGLLNQIDIGGVMIFALLILVGAIAHQADLWLNRKQGLTQDQIFHKDHRDQE